MIYIVTDKASGAEVTRYAAAQLFEGEFPLSSFDHTEWVEGATDPVNQSRLRTKLEYLRRFTMEERIAVRQAAGSNPMLADYLAMMELAEEIDTGDADTIAAVNMLEQVGLIGIGRANEVLNG